MGTRNSNGVERRRVPLDGNRPRTHPKHPGRKATKTRPPSGERDERLKDGDVVEHLPHALTGRPATGAHADVQETRIGGAP